jgi:heme/copper-type cytochrome/quinol oxidase subunit 4
MIQRSQSIFLLTVAILSLMLAFSNSVFYTVSNSSKTEQVQVEYDETIMIAQEGKNSEINSYLLGFLGAIIATSLIAIFLYKKRTLQIRVASLNYLWILGLLVMMYFYSMHMKYFESTSGYTLLALLPLALLFFTFLAIRGIKKDEALVRSMDRLR